jgi:hypothetical protein
MDPLPLRRRVWFGVAPNADPNQPRPWLTSSLRLSEHGLPSWSRSLAVEVNLDKALAALVTNAHGQAVKGAKRRSFGSTPKCPIAKLVRRLA